MNRYKNKIFRINDDFYFTIKIRYGYLKQLGYTDLVKVFFCSKNHDLFIVFREETLFTVLSYFKQMSERLLSKQLTVGEKDIVKGIVYNQSLAYHTTQGYSHEANTQRYKWTFYSLFTNQEKNTVWLYEYNSEFYVEIAPLYCALPTNTKEKFSLFMNDYKPKFIIKVSSKAVQKWYKKSYNMLEQLKKNHESSEHVDLILQQ